MPSVLSGERVTIRPLRPGDAPALDRILRDRRVTRTLPPRVRRESGREFVDRVLEEQRAGKGFAFAILPIGSSEVVGQVRLIDWSESERRAEVGFWLRRSSWGQGFGTDALRLVCGYGFRVLRLHRIEATVIVGNDRSAGALTRVGFRAEGRRRRGARVPRGWADEWTFGLLRGELRDAPSTGPWR